MQSFAAFASAVQPCSVLSLRHRVSCCGYDQKMMQGGAADEKLAAGGSAVPAERGLTLIFFADGN